MKISVTLSILYGLAITIGCTTQTPLITGELKKWHTVTLTFNGPQSHEDATPNPFTDYRLIVRFACDSEEYSVPGYFAADGNAAISGAREGNKWRVHFTPDKEGTWSYKAAFVTGDQIAINDDPSAGKPAYFDGAQGTFTIQSTDKGGRDFRGKGRLQYTGSRYLRFAGRNECFLKGGADSPENFLAYVDFDGTQYMGDSEQRMGEASPNASLHAYSNHVQDWRPGDPLWQDGKGKGIIGALNYLADKGMNSVYFLTLNIRGDGEDVWPYTDYNERQRFDCSKLDQWEIVFSHMDRMGLMLHLVTQETENELLLDSGETGPLRKLYYRELIARFAHHLAITWNMGEENGFADFTPKAQSRQQQKDMVRYVKAHDPYNSFVVIHTHSNPRYRYEIFDELLGYPFLDGPSIQIGDPPEAHYETLVWIRKSNEAGRQWVVNVDEIGPASRGVDPDDRKDKNNQDSVRSYVLWANLMAGGGGVEWYFGYRNHDNDLDCEDWRSRDRMWDYTRIALEFFHRHLKFWNMDPTDDLINNPGAYCLSKPGESYAVYLPAGGGRTSIDLTGVEGAFVVKWYDPRKGGTLMDGPVTTINGGKVQELGTPPSHASLDWAVLINRE